MIHFMRDVFVKHPSIDYFASFSLVAEFMVDPLKYFDNNNTVVSGGEECGKQNIVFSLQQQRRLIYS